MGDIETATQEDVRSECASFVISDLFSDKSADWRTVKASLCGATMTIEDHVRSDREVFAQIDTLQNQLPLTNTPFSAGRECVSNEKIPSEVDSSTHPSNVYSNDDSNDETDYGEVLVDRCAMDAMSTVTPATFALRGMNERMSYNHPMIKENQNDHNLKIRNRRKILIGCMVLIVVVLLTVVIGVPIAIKSKDRRVSSQYTNSVESNNESDGQDSSTKGKDHNDDLNESTENATGENSVVMSEMDPTSSPNQSEKKETPSPSFATVSMSTSSSPTGKIQSGESKPFAANVYPSVSPVSPTTGRPQGNGQTQPLIGNMTITVSSPSSSTLTTGSGSTSSSDVTPSMPHSPFILATVELTPSPQSVDVGLTNSPTDSVTLTSTLTNSEESTAPSPVSSVGTSAPSSPTKEPKFKPTAFTSSTVKIQLQTDKLGYETSWTLESIDVDDATNKNTSTIISSVEENTYASFQKDSKTVTLPRGTYKFVLRDAFGDGFCCKEFEGFYSLSIDEREVIRGGYYRSEVSYTFQIGYFPVMTERDNMWLLAHNQRRKNWHERNGVSYVPLRWSGDLAAHAVRWADRLTGDCKIVGIEHEHGIEEGENLAKNRGNDPNSGMGVLYPPENILRRWVDMEADLGVPRNLHLTQALWRGTKYVGCGEAERYYDDGSVCRIQVCRYVKAGNCEMSKYNSTEGDNYLIPMLMEDTPCPPECPPEGCF